MSSQTKATQHIVVSWLYQLKASFSSFFFLILMIIIVVEHVSKGQANRGKGACGLVVMGLKEITFGT